MKKKKTFAFVLLGFFLISVALLAVLVLNNKPSVVFVENPQFDYHSTSYASQLIENSDHCTLVKDVLLDTETIGEHEVEVVMQSSFVYNVTFKTTYYVRDSEPPVFTKVEGIVLPLNSDVSELLQAVVVTDNFDGADVYVEVANSVDLSKSGKQTVVYQAIDAAGNIAQANGYVIVEVGGSKATYFTTKKGFLGYTKDGKTYIDGALIVNKSYSVPANYGAGLTEEFTNAFRLMQSAAASDGQNIYITSGYHSYAYQSNLFNEWVNISGSETSLKESAKPGTSEHQTGLAADFNTVSGSFENTSQFQWLMNNCYKYGFILRYTKDGESATGFMYEPWHYRYVGEELAQILWNNGEWLNIETYFGIASVYPE